MKFVEISVSWPVATTLLTAAVALAGIFAFPKLAVSPLPQVDFPTIMVQAQMPGGSPEVMATSVTAPLERHLSRIADVTQITSQSSQGNSRIILQFGLDRDINGAVNGKPAVLLIVYRQPGANIIETADRIKKSIPSLRASVPGDTQITVTSDRTATIRASLQDTEFTLLTAVGLVIVVVFVFLPDVRAMLVPGFTVLASIIGTFAGMYLLGYSLNNLTLMALTIATGFVVDDVVVVLENIARHMEAGMSRTRAAIEGSREVAFTVVSITASLIGVFFPILLMGGIVGRFFREFSMTLAIAISISLVLALTTTPMLCSRFLRVKPPKRQRGFLGLLERIISAMSTLYRLTLRWALAHSLLVLLIGLTIAGLNFYLIAIVPKGFFPEEDTGFMVGGIWPDASISFQALKQKLERLQTIVQSDPAVESLVGYTPGGSAYVFLSLKPLNERHATMNEIMARLRPKLDQVPGGQLFLAPVQDFHVGGRVSLSQYQFTLLGDNTEEIYEWTPKLTEALKRCPELVDVVSDQRQKALETDITIDRSTVARLGLDPSAIDNTLYDAFGQCQRSTIP